MKKIFRKCLLVALIVGLVLAIALPLAAFAAPPTLTVSWDGTGTATGTVVTPSANTGFNANGTGNGVFTATAGFVLSSTISATDNYGTVLYGINHNDTSLTDSITNWDNGYAAVTASASTTWAGVQGTSALAANSTNYNLISQAVVDPSGTGGVVFVNASVVGNGLANITTNFNANDELFHFIGCDSIVTSAAVSVSGAYINADINGNVNNVVQVIGTYVGSGSAAITYTGTLATP